MELMRPDIERILKEAGMTRSDFFEKVLSHEMGLSVTKRASLVDQPYGGFLSAKQFSKTSLGEGERALNPTENIHGSLIGIAVDYMTRVMLGTSVSDAFRVSLTGAKRLSEEMPESNAFKRAKIIAAAIKGLDDASLICAIKLAGFDVCSRSDPSAYKPIELINPDCATLENVRTMIRRSIYFLDVYGPKVLDGFTFEGGYTLTVITGDGDFTTADTLWDFKVTKQSITKSQTLQLLMYWRMGVHSIHPEFQSITQLGFYNPRKNIVSRIKTSDISAETIDIVDHVVIGYKD